MSGLVAGKVAVVTGAGSGIGRESARLFVREGAMVVLSDVDERAAQATLELIEAESGTGSAVSIACDVSKSNDVELLVATAVRAFGRLDCAHNNAGIRHTSALLADIEEEEYDRVLDVNLKGVWLCMKFEIRQMLQTGGGSVVNTASRAGIRGSTTAGAYAASKHGVVGLTRSGALGYGKSGIRVNAICPGLTATPLVLDQLEPERLAHLQRNQVGGRMADPLEMAQAAVWLCSDRASYVSGVALPVDAGWSAG